MIKILRRLAEGYAWLFWILCVLFYVVGYKVFSVNVLEKSSYDYGVAFFKLSLALLAIIMMKEIYNGAFSFHFRIQNILQGIILVWPTLLFVYMNLSGGSIRSEKIVPETLLMVVVSNMMTGFYEEVLMRGMLLGHMMQHWKGDRHRILKSVVATSVLFGVVHLGNLVYGQVFATLVQVVYATAIGFVFAAAYLRYRNLWACVLLHGIVNISANLYTIYDQPGAEVELSGNSNLLILLLIIVITFVVAFYEFRKKKREEIIKLWDEDTESLQVI